VTFLRSPYLFADTPFTHMCGLLGCELLDLPKISGIQWVVNFRDLIGENICVIFQFQVKYICDLRWGEIFVGSVGSKILSGNSCSC